MVLWSDGLDFLTIRIDAMFGSKTRQQAKVTHSSFQKNNGNVLEWLAKGPDLQSTAVLAVCLDAQR